MLNHRKLENAELLPSPTLVKTAPSPSEIDTSKKRTKTPEKVTIEYKTQYIETKKYKAKKQSKLRRHYEKVIPGLKAEIIKFEDFITRVRSGISNFKNKILNLTKRVSGTADIRTEHNNVQAAVSSQSRDIRYFENEIDKATENQSKLTVRFDTAREVEYQIDKTSDTIEGEIREAENIQSNLENGDFEYFLHKKLTETIGSRRGENKKLETEIKELEKSIASKIETTTSNAPSPFRLR